MNSNYWMEDIRRAVATKGKALAGHNEWIVYLGEHTLIIRFSGCPLREVDNAQVISWSLDGYDTMTSINQIHADSYNPAYLATLHAILIK